MKDTSSPTQNNLPIAGIQDNVVIMNDGGLRVVLKIDPINFELKSEDEQNSTIYSYQQFLNSLSFPIQIVVQSKKLDLQGYLGRMEKFKKNITNDLLKIQIEDYIGFVDNLISVANIMSKQFYVVINYSPISTKNITSPLTRILHQQVTSPLIDQDQFDRYKAEIFSRANMVAGGLSRLGLKVHLMDTQKLIELYYSIYNPDIAAEEKLTNVSEIISENISKTSEGAETQTEEVEPQKNEVLAPGPVAPEAPLEPDLTEPPIEETPLAQEENKPQ